MVALSGSRLVVVWQGSKKCDLMPTMTPEAADLIQIIMSPIQQAMDSKGITVKSLVNKLKSELNAKETKFFQKDGNVVESRNVIAWDVRQRARIDAHKLRGDYPADRHIFPDAAGKPQNISTVFGETERSARLIFLLERAEKRAKEASNAASSGS